MCNIFLFLGVTSQGYHKIVFNLCLMYEYFGTIYRLNQKSESFANECASHTVSVAVGQTTARSSM